MLCTLHITDPASHSHCASAYASGHPILDMIVCCVRWWEYSTFCLPATYVLFRPTICPLKMIFPSLNIVLLPQSLCFISSSVYKLTCASAVEDEKQCTTFYYSWKCWSLPRWLQFVPLRKLIRINISALLWLYTHTACLALLKKKKDFLISI